MLRPEPIACWNEDLQAEWQAYALTCYPYEAVAYVAGGRLVPVPNISSDPTTSFKVDVTERFRAERFGPIQALLHTHPYTAKDSPTHKWAPEWASTADMQFWMQDNIPWGIWSTDGEGLSRAVWMHHWKPQPLLGREFMHGAQDCYAIIRDWYYLERSIKLLNFARGMEWWNDGTSNLYEDNFKKAGFRVLRADETPDVGDVPLMRLVGNVISHGGVISKPGVLMHHPYSSKGTALSREDPLQKWKRCIVKTVRYDPVS